MLTKRFKDYFTIKKKQKAMKKRTNEFLRKIQKVHKNKRKMRKSNSLVLSTP